MMKRLVVVFAVFLCSVPLSGQKARYGQGLPIAKPGIDYPIKVHVYGVYIRSYCQSSPLDRYGESCGDTHYAEVIANGKKFELRGDWGIPDPFHPYLMTLLIGDYRARSEKDDSSNVVNLGDRYDLVLPDNRVLRCTVTGISE
jgi:hypothetical protein